MTQTELNNIIRDLEARGAKVDVKIQPIAELRIVYPLDPGARTDDDATASRPTYTKAEFIRARIREGREDDREIAELAIGAGFRNVPPSAVAHYRRQFKSYNNQ